MNVFSKFDASFTMHPIYSAIFIRSKSGPESIIYDIHLMYSSLSFAAYFMNHGLTFHFDFLA